MKSIAFFDVDGTLLDGISGYFTTLELVRRGILKKRRVLQAVYYKLIGTLCRLDDIKKIYEIAIADMAGHSIEYIYGIGNEIFERDLKSKMFLEALSEIEKHKKNGVPVILISSGPTMAIQAIARFVKADDFFSIGPKIENNQLSNKLVDELAFMEGKIRIAETQAKKRGLSLQECFFYADSVHDKHLLSAVGMPHAVNPDRGLRKEALRKNWPILQFKKTLGQTP